VLVLLIGDGTSFVVVVLLLFGGGACGVCGGATATAVVVAMAMGPSCLGLLRFMVLEGARLIFEI